MAVSPDALKPVGFGRDEGLLPYPARSFVGYRLLTEFFTFPQKFLFVDVDVPPAALARGENQLELFIYLNRQAADLEPNITADAFKLSCTPMVNLFSQRAEPIRVHAAGIRRYRVVPGSCRRPLAHEVYSVDRVTATAPGWPPARPSMQPVLLGEAWRAARKRSLLAPHAPGRGSSRAASRRHGRGSRHRGVPVVRRSRVQPSCSGRLDDSHRNDVHEPRPTRRGFPSAAANRNCNSPRRLARSLA